MLRFFHKLKMKNERSALILSVAKDPSKPTEAQCYSARLLGFFGPCGALRMSGGDPRRTKGTQRP